MEAWEIAIHIGAPVLSAAVATAVTAWRLSAKFQKLESKALEHTKEIEEQKDAHEQLERDVETLTRENAQSWGNLNFMLGQISQAMGLAPPMRPPSPSKPVV